MTSVAYVADQDAAARQIRNNQRSEMVTLALPAGRFYTLEASRETPEPLVVSGLYSAETPVNWEEMEITFEPGQKSIEAPEGVIDTPNGFHALYEAS